MKYFIQLFLAIGFAASGVAQETKELNIGDQIANFSTLDDNGNEWNSNTVKTDFLVVYFQPMKNKSDSKQFFRVLKHFEQILNRI